jgi:hypothetical protein
MNVEERMVVLCFMDAEWIPRQTLRKFSVHGVRNEYTDSASFSVNDLVRSAYSVVL